jgi:hypothetical protein
VAGFLVGHEFDQAAGFGAESSGGELFVGEASEAVVEEIELDPLLVETERDGLEVEVGLDHVSGQAAIGAETTSWCIWRWHGVQGNALGVVISGGWVGW